MAVSLGFHILFAVAGMALPGLMVLAEWRHQKTGELWGNYPQTYSLVGLINCAGLLSRPWSAVR